jgi:predicted Fe-Mo cluster-binding NifX family protein
MPVLGVVANMGYVVCPHCGKSLPFFKSAGGDQSIQSLGLPIISSLPFDPQVVEAADAGRLTEVDTSKSPFFQALNHGVDFILTTVGQSEPQKNLQARLPGVSKFAIPVQDGQLSQIFGQSQQFALITVQDNHIVDQVEASPPDFKPGILPAWFDLQGVTHIIAAEIGEQAKKFFQRKGIAVITGAPALSPEVLVDQYLDNRLQATTG